jgi:hypothetical protein
MFTYPRKPVREDPMRARFWLAFLISVVMLLACGTEKKPFNRLSIGIDTLRPDHLGCYGYQRNTSPAIDRLAQEGVLFQNTISQSS